jgi:hypothetical protein
MQHRSWFGWLLLGAFCAAVSCGGDGGSGNPPGFGAACTSNKECAAYSLLCGPDKTCVECLGDAVCKTGEACSGGLCKVPAECSRSRDCSGAQVCDEDAGVCVDCLTSTDCAEGQKCANHNCSNRPKCAFTSDCTNGLLCLIDPGVCVSCRTDDDCSTRRVCEDYECVVPEPVSSGGKSSGGSGGKSSTAGAGGKVTTAGTSTGGTLAGGSGGNGGKAGAGGTSGAGGMSGDAGSSGEGGVGGALDCGCLAGYDCTPDLRCVATNVIDDLLDCDDQILSIAGRQGKWLGEADVGIGFTHGFTDPGATWTDRTCAAWATGSELTADGPDTTFAWIGFGLNVDALDEPLAYDLSQYTGLQIQLETKSSTPTSVQVALTTTDGGHYQYTLTAINGSSYLRSAPFVSMVKMADSANVPLDLSKVSEIQFLALDPTAFAFAIHRVTLY